MSLNKFEPGQKVVVYEADRPACVAWIGQTLTIKSFQETEKMWAVNETKLMFTSEQLIPIQHPNFLTEFESLLRKYDVELQLIVEEDKSGKPQAVVMVHPTSSSSFGLQDYIQTSDCRKC